MLILESVLSFLTEQKVMVIVLLSSLTVKTILGILFLTFSIFKNKFCIRKRVKFAVFLLSLDMLIFGLYNHIESVKSIAIISLVLTINFCVVTLTIRVKEKKIKEVIVPSCNDEHSDYLVKKPILEPLILSKGRGYDTYENRSEVNFSHVKSILDKMEYYPLTQADRRVVKELYSCINLAKNGEDISELKTRINDGLNDLLKIMSKYGV